MSFPNILISIKKFDYHLLISQIKRKNVVNRKEVRSEECDEHTAKKKKSPSYIIDLEACKKTQGIYLVRNSWGLPKSFPNMREVAKL